jgi:hypothetical protein
MPRKKLTKTTQTTPSPILSSLSVGAMITISQSGRQVYVTPLDDAPGQYGIAAGPMGAGAGPSTFVITMYSFDGGNEAKLSLQPLGMPNYYWIAGQNTGGLLFPILLESTADHFLLTDMGQGALSMENTVSPPAPYVRGFSWATGGILTYGHDAPLLQGIFQIQVVG